MTDRITLQLQHRIILGKKVKSLRRTGIVPVHLYGTGINARSLQCQVKELIKVLSQAGGNTAVSISVEGEAGDNLAFVREVQWDPIMGDLLHVDFLRAEVTQLISVEVPVVLAGESPGSRAGIGTVVHQLHSLTVEALPLDMPQDITADLSSLVQAGDVVRVGDIAVPSGATLITSPEEVVVRLEAARVEVMEEKAPADETEPE